MSKCHKLLQSTTLLVVAMLASAGASADELNGADTAWVLTSTALVLFMTIPGLALFYGGLVNRRNVLSVLMHCVSIACLMSVLWLVVGYSIAFGDGGTANAVWGGLGKMFLIGIGPDTLSGTIPEVLFFAFQMTFAIITPALIVGAYVERITYGFVLMFSSLWMLLCYAPVAHWVWGGGWLAALSVMDFAGGIVVLVKATQLVYPIRVPEEEEFDGLDITSHGERAYEMTS